MARSEVRFHSYARRVRTGAQGALILAARLAHDAPDDLDRHERARLEGVRDAALHVQEVMNARDREMSLRVAPLLADFINDWSACHEVLRARARIRDAISDTGARARALLTHWLADGVRFTRAPVTAAWAEGDRLLERVDDEKLRAELEILVGADVLKSVRRSTAALADVLGTGDVPVALPRKRALSDAVASFGDAVAAYVRALAAHVDEDDAESVERFRGAVVPIDEHRARRRSRAAPEPTPDVARSAA